MLQNYCICYKITQDILIKLAEFALRNSQIKPNSTSTIWKRDVGRETLYIWGVSFELSGVIFRK